MTRFSGVLLGLAEVKVPLRRLPQEERCRLAHVCYRKLLDMEHEKDEDQVRCIGVVDSFYALQEVVFTVENDLCQLWRKEAAILQHRLRDVIVAVPSKEHKHRIIVMSTTANFGRTALVLQMMSNEAASALLLLLSPPKDERDSFVRCSPIVASSRKDRASFGKAVTKKFNSFLTSITSPQVEAVEKVAAPIVGNSVEQSVYPLELEEDDQDDDSDSDTDSESPSSSTEQLPACGRPEKISFSKLAMSPLDAEIEFLLSSERSYVEYLNKVADMKRSMIQGTCYLSASQFLDIYRHTEDLLDLHNKFIEDLESCFNDASFIINVFSNYCERFVVYVDFLGNVPNVDPILKRFGEYFKACYPDLPEGLRRPRMRLNYYVLTLESLQKKCSQDENQIISDVVEVMKKFLKEADKKLTLNSVKGCPFDLSNHGDVILTSEAFLRRGQGLAKRRYQLLLLEDLLVLAKGTPDSCEYFVCFSVESLELLNPMRGLLFHLKVEGKTKRDFLRLVFKTKTIKLQQKWIEAISKTIANHQTFIKTKRYSIPTDDADLINLLPIQKRSSDRAASISDDGGKTEQPYSDLLDESKCDTLKETESSSIIFNANLPPLTVLAAFPSVNRLMSTDDKKPPDTDFILKSERSLLKRIRTKLDQLDALRGADIDEFRRALSEVYDIHSKHCIPAIKSNMPRSGEHVLCHRLLEESEAFQRSYSRVLSTLAVLKYEKRERDVDNNLSIILSNVLTYRKLFQITSASYDLSDSIFEAAVNLIDATFQKANQLLKKKYIRNFDKHLKVVAEGWIKVKFSSTHEQISYLLLSTDTLYIISAKDHSYIVKDAANLQQSRLNFPLGSKDFEIISSFNNQKTKYKFKALDEMSKNDWIKSLSKAFNEKKKKRFSVSEESEEEVMMRNKRSGIIDCFVPVTTEEYPGKRAGICTLESDL